MSFNTGVILSSPVHQYLLSSNTVCVCVRAHKSAFLNWIKNSESTSVPKFHLCKLVYLCTLTWSNEKPEKRNDRIGTGKKGSEEKKK